DLPLEIGPDDRDALGELYENFTEADAERVKTIETEGTANHPATNHDVKAVEYLLRDELPDPDAVPWVHFGLTSEDVNNLARRLSIKPAVEEVLLPALDSIRESFEGLAGDSADTPMLARTHGQPATPTTFGKEMAVYVGRLDRAIERIE